MEPSGTSTIEYDYALIAPGLSRLADTDVASLEPLVGGRNSRVYRIDCAGGQAYVAKIYPETPGSDRRAREFAASSFMWKRAIRSIPEPLFTDPNRSCSIFRYVEGFPISAEGVVAADVDASVGFLRSLDALKYEPASRGLGLASEACLSLEANFDHLRRRIGVLRVAADPGVSRAHAELRALLEDEIEPLFEDAIERSLDLYAEQGLCAESVLGERAATLSPSDFGFHNARRTSDGGLVFLDFEHFGWDDPAKLVSDFLLHPGFDLEPALRTRFFERMCRDHACGGEIAWRVPVVLPLYALKWSTILLNEFVSEHRSRRDHVGALLGPDEGLLERQLDKARSMLARTRGASHTSGYATHRTEPARPFAGVATGS